ncbi:virulence factor SrfC family protein [Breoghania sp. L-A4]|uniref:virulence factor SrfC family protein n=1 Tax=Breoghania sp. L-A4 TaxID=2304600 RepID=UPI000E35E3DE|nr:virulence factor SrfC family protein [Breoghania sp. L-A4]AXS40689.1 virulence factor SrfC-like protein [Breoghania sp. L-A4]
MTDWHTLCDETLDAARRGISWVNDEENQKVVGLERKVIDRRLRQLTTEVSKIGKAVDRPMCVGVFGPSQAGKSYLVSVLARKGEDPLMARFAGHKDVDFISEINPGGERESTGIVTRFSLRQLPSPEGYPVCLRLLSEIDIVKILGNSFFMDGDPRKLGAIEPDELSDALNRGRSRMADQPKSENQLVTEDIWDLQNYFEKSFDGARALEALRGFWDEASVIAPKLSIADRGALFSVLWGGIEEFTAIYLQATRALAQLGFAADAFSPISALLPRTESIIDVQTLGGIGKPDQAMLEIRSFDGAPISLPRPMVTALVAELHITITEKPWAFFDTTDLLDFPGARERQKLDLRTYVKEEGKDPLKELLVRGKVAYLFDRYVAEQELTSMLLCVRPSNQDVVTLPDMIDNWISVTHGPTAQDRVGKTVVLFLMLTWFDTHFVEKAGEEGQDPGERFKARLFSSIESFFGKSHAWPEEWTPGQAFNNCFWLRNPGIKSEFMIEYEGRSEKAILPQKQAYIDSLREGYLKQPSVQKFFKDPAKAFDEALRLNDGGVSFLADQLAPVCHPQLKEEQIAGRLGKLREDLAAALAPFYVDSDIEKRLKERVLVSQTILRHIQRLAQERRFADLLASMQITQQGFASVIHDAFNRRASNGHDDEADEAPPVQEAAVPDLPPLPGLPPIPGMDAAPAPTPTAKKPANGGRSVQTADEFLASAAVEHWLNVLYTSADGGHLARFFRGDPKLAQELVSEVSAAAVRKDLVDDVAAMIKRLSGSISEDIDLYLEKATFAAAAVINRFVSHFGFDAMPENERPSAPGEGGAQRPIFVPRQAANSAAQMSLNAVRFDYEALADWMYALHATVEANAKSTDGLNVNVEQNIKVGAILETLNKTLPGVGTRSLG